MTPEENRRLAAELGTRASLYAEQRLAAVPLAELLMPGRLALELARAFLVGVEQAADMVKKQ